LGASPVGGYGNSHQIRRVQGNKITRGGTKLALLPCSLILAYEVLEEENLDQKSPGLPSWGLMQQAHQKKENC